MKIKTLFAISAMAIFSACNSNETQTSGVAKTTEANFDVMAESFADLQILRYQVPGFESRQQKKKNCVIIYMKHRFAAGILFMIKKVSMAFCYAKRSKVSTVAIREIKTVKTLKSSQIMPAGFGLATATTTTMATKNLFRNAVLIILNRS